VDESKYSTFKDHILVLAPHEGIVSSETWLAVQDRKSQQQKIPSGGDAKNSWLVGLVKCAHCNRALNITYRWNKAHTIQWRYYYDSGFARAESCVKSRLLTRPDDVEQFVFEAMKARLDEITIAKKKKSKPDKEVERLQNELIRIDAEVNGLMEKVAMADDEVFAIINKRLKEFLAKKSDIEEEIRIKQRKHKEIDTVPLQEPLSKWDTLTMDEKHSLAMLMIKYIRVSDETGIEFEMNV
jgi:hypothetical protein